MLARLRGRIRSMLWAWVPPRAVPELSSLIAELNNRVAGGQSRFAASPVPLHLAWFPEGRQPTAEDRDMSDAGIPSESTELRDFYFDEVRVLRETITTPDDQIPLASWQQLDGDTEFDRAGRSMWIEVNKDAIAMSSWDRFAIPNRLHGNYVARIWSPTVVDGEPIIRRVPVGTYVAAVSVKTALDAYRIIQLQTQRTCWIVLAGVAIIAHFVRS